MSAALLVGLSCIADCGGELRWSVRDARLYVDRQLNPLSLALISLEGAGAASLYLALVLNSEELVVGVSFHQPANGT